MRFLPRFEACLVLALTLGAFAGLTLSPLACASGGDGDGDGDGDKPDANIVSLSDGGNPEPEPTVNPEPEPTAPGALRIVTFEVDNAAPTFKDNVQLSWFVENAVSCQLGLDEDNAPTQAASTPSGVLTTSAELPGVPITWRLSCSDGVVTDEETATFTTLDAVYNANFTASTDAQLTQLVGITRVKGSVTLLGPEITSLDALSNLVFVENGFFVSFTSAGALTLDELRDVGDDFFLSDNASASTLSAPRLDRVGGEFYISRNFALGPTAPSALASQVEAGGGIDEFALLYENRAGAVLDANYESVFLCDIDTPGFALMQMSGDQLTLEEYDVDDSFVDSVTGDFEVDEQNLQLSFPLAGIIDEATTIAVFEYDRLVRFSSPSIPLCVAVEAGPGDALDADYTAECPGLGGAALSSLTLTPDGQARWTRNGETEFGIYRLAPSRIDFAFGGLALFSRFSAARDFTDALDFRRFDVSCDLNLDL